MVAIRGFHHNRPSEDGRALAPGGVSSLLALEIPQLKWPANSFPRDQIARSADERRQSFVGRTAHSWRTVEAGI